MDTLGDADGLDDDAAYSDEQAPRNQLMTQVGSTESLAVASLVLSVCSFFAGSLFQFLSFVIGTSFSDPRSQYLIVASPTAVL